MTRDELLRDYARVIDEQQERIWRLEEAIRDTCDLADRLDAMAGGGAGFVDHWGTRVQQAVRGLRDVLGGG